MIDPVVKYIDEKYKNSVANIGIIGTKATIQSKNYEKKVQAITDEHITSVDEKVSLKEKEIMTI